MPTHLVSNDAVTESDGTLNTFLSGEKHIVSAGSWVACAGQDNTDRLCTIGTIPTILNSKASDHCKLTPAFQSESC